MNDIGPFSVVVVCSSRGDSVVTRQTDWVLQPPFHEFYTHHLSIVTYGMYDMIIPEASYTVSKLVSSYLAIALKVSIFMQAENI